MSDSASCPVPPTEHESNGLPPQTLYEKWVSYRGFLCSGLDNLATFQHQKNLPVGFNLEEVKNDPRFWFDGRVYLPHLIQYEPSLKYYQDRITPWDRHTFPSNYPEISFAYDFDGVIINSFPYVIDPEGTLRNAYDSPNLQGFSISFWAARNVNFTDVL